MCETSLIVQNLADAESCAHARRAAEAHGERLCGCGFGSLPSRVLVAFRAVKSSERGTLTRATVSVGAALGGAIASSYQLNDLAALISIGGAVAPDMLPHLVAMGRRRLELLAPSFFDGVSSGAERPIEQAVQSPDDAEALFEAYRRLANTPEAFAAKALGKLAGLYMRNGWTVDQFFRAAGRVIEELGPEDYDALQKIVAAAGTNAQHTDDQAIELALNPHGGEIEGAGAQVFFRKGTDSWRGLKDEHGNLEKTPGTIRAFFLLRAHGLATEMPGATAFNVKGVSSDSLRLDLEIVGARLREVLERREI